MKTWFITGASRGFGRIWAEAALNRGDSRGEVINLVLLQEGAHLHSRLKTEKPSKLRGRECIRPVGFERQAFERCSRQILPPGFESLCNVFRQFQRDLHERDDRFIIAR